FGFHPVQKPGTPTLHRKSVATQDSMRPRVKWKRGEIECEHEQRTENCGLHETVRGSACGPIANFCRPSGAKREPENQQAPEKFGEVKAAPGASQCLGLAGFFRRQRVMRYRDRCRDGIIWRHALRSLLSEVGLRGN